MYKTKEEAQARLDLVTSDNYYSHGVERHAPLAGVWSKSELKKLCCNTAEWFAEVPFRGSAKTEFGSLVDCLATEPEKYISTYYLTTETDKRKKGFLDAKKAAEEARMTVVTARDVRRAETAIEKLQANPFGQVLLNGEKQVTLKGLAKLTGPLGEVWVPIKGRPDSITHHADGSITIEDLKTTAECEPSSIIGVCKYLSYHWQDAIYTILAKQNGYDVRDFRFVFVGTDEPFHVQPAKFDLDARDQGVKCLEKALSAVYWIGHGHGINALYPEELIIGPYKPKHYWDTCPDFNLPLVDVEW